MPVSLNFRNFFSESLEAFTSEFIEVFEGMNYICIVMYVRIFHCSVESFVVYLDVKRNFPYGLDSSNLYLNSPRKQREQGEFIRVKSSRSTFSIENL